MSFSIKHEITRNGIQLDVQWDLTSSMVGDHDHVSTASSQRD